MLYESVFILSGQISTKSAEKKFDSFTEKIEKSGGKISKIYFCPDLSSKENNCRKPSTKMFEKALEDFPKIDLKKSKSFNSKNK